MGMGVLPLELTKGDSADSLGITGKEVFDITGLSDEMGPRPRLRVKARKPDGTEVGFDVVARLDSKGEVNYYRNGGILHTVLRNLIQ